MNFLNLKKLYFSSFLISAAFLTGLTTATAQTAELQSATGAKEEAKIVKTDFTENQSADSAIKPADSIDLPPSPPEIYSIAKNEKTAINPPKVDANTLRHLSLDSALNLLTQNNLSVIAARYNVNLAQAQKIVAALRPAASVTVTFNQLTIPRLFRTPSEFYTTNGNAAANASYIIEYDRLIERGNKRNLRVSQADLNSRAAESLVRDALRQQTSQLKQSFLTALLARENLSVALDNYKTFETSQIILGAQVKEGYAAGVDLKRIELQKLQYQRDISTAEQNFQQSTRDIYNLIGIGDAFSVVDDVKSVNYDDAAFIPQMKTDLEILEGNLDIAPVLLSIADLRTTALENRPDVKNAELNLEAAKAGFKLAQALQKRDITVGAQYMRSGSDNTVGVTATVLLGIKKRAELAQTQAQINIKLAESNLRLVQTQALTDVEKAFTAYMTSRARLHLFTDKALVNAFDVRKIVEISYRAGAKGLLDYLDAQRIYNQTLLDYNQTRFDFLLSLTQLEAAAGTKIADK